MQSPHTCPAPRISWEWTSWTFAYWTFLITWHWLRPLKCGHGSEAGPWVDGELVGPDSSKHGERGHVPACLRVFSVKCQGKLRDGTVAMTWMWHGCPGAAGQGWHMIAIGSLCRRAPPASSASVESYNSPLQLYIELPSIRVQPAISTKPKAAVGPGFL